MEYLPLKRPTEAGGGEFAGTLMTALFFFVVREQSSGDVSFDGLVEDHKAIVQHLA